MVFHLKNERISLKANSGFSMVELMATMLIFTILSAGLFAVSMVAESSWQTNKVRIELQQELRKGMEALIFDLRLAGPSSITNVPADSNWYNTITFKTPTGVTSGSIAWDNNSIQFLKGGTGAIQLLRLFNSQTRIVCTNLQTLQFRRQASTPQILEVAMQAQKDTVKGLPITYSLNFNIQLRN